MEASIKDIPHGITIRTPNIDMTAAWTFRLPFYEFENSLRLSYDPIAPSGYIVEDQAAEGDVAEGLTSFQDVVALEGQLGGEINSTNHAVANTWTPGASVLTTLESVVPQPMVDGSLHGFPLTYLDIRVFTSPLHRQILCSVANNFVGLDGLPIQTIIHCLQKESNEKLYRTVRSAQGYTARAIVQSLFKAAVEAGDARVVDVLIRENPADIKINEQSVVIHGQKYTPIERATLLRHEELVEIFLTHGAEVNRTYTNDGIGALDFAVVGYFRSRRDVDDTPSQPRIFRKLLEKGGELCQSAMERLVKEGGELAVLIMSKHACKFAAQWCRWGVFRDAILFLDDQSSMKVIEIMLKCGVDLNHGVGNYKEDYSIKVLDVAAQRGQLPMVDLLLKSGASLTGNTLPCAVKSQNKDLVRLLLESGADINSIGTLQITTLSVAIELRDNQMIRFLETQGASVINQSKEHCAAAILAASEAGNIQFLERLVQLGGSVSPEDWGNALLFATIDNRDEDVEKLIDAGADVNLVKRNYRFYKGYEESKGPPLCEVLKRRKESLAFSLLNADANPNISGISSPIQLAVEWGNRSVIEALIFAGVDVNHCNMGDTALAIAVKRRDFGLIKLLLASGASINSYPVNTEAVNPLETAAEIGDIDMAQYLIDQGADPNNSRALEKSFIKNQELFNLLCETYHARYPSARGEFGTRVLMHVIENENHDAIKRMLQRGVNPEAMWKPRSRPPFDGPPFEGPPFDPHPFDCDSYIHTFNRLRELTALGYAIFRQKENITEYLLQYGCDANGIVLQGNGMTHREMWEGGEWGGVGSSREPAILAAIGTQRISMVELLIKYRAKVNFPTSGLVTRTPLQKAAELGNIGTVTLLINNGADVNAPAARRGGGTSLPLAAIGGYIPVACKLLNQKADVNAPGSKINGRTALEGAAEHGRLDMVKLLLNAGAGLRRGDEKQVATAIALARENEFLYICDLLESYFHRRQGQDSGPEMLLHGSDDEPREWNLDEDQILF